MSNSNRNSDDFPPDDFSKTTPGIRIPGGNNYPSNREEPLDDWGKTNYNFNPKGSSPSPSSPPADEWGKTAVNINVPRHQPPDDFGGRTMPPSEPRRDSNWDATQANINVPRGGGGYGQDNYGGGNRQPEYGATTPYFQLPENERAKYQNLPPVAAPPVDTTQKNEQKKKSWIWAIIGLAVMFLFAIGVFAIVYFVFLRTKGFELTVKGAPSGSDIFVDGQRWNLSSADGSYRLPGLKADEIKTIEIKRNGFTCQPQKVTGENGVPKEIVAQCTENPVAPPPNNECANIKKGEFDKAAKCANDALDALKDPFTVDDLLKAMNMYIINFPSGKYDIVKPADKAFIQKAAGYIQKLPPDVKIEVGGHTDNVGRKESNAILSDNRAKSVKNALVAAGVKDTVLQTKGYGDSKPKPGNNNANEDEKFQNRRIEYSKLGS